MLVNRFKTPFERIFNIRKFDSCKTNRLKQRRLYRLYLRTHTNLLLSDIRRMKLKDLRSECHKRYYFYDYFRVNHKY